MRKWFAALLVLSSCTWPECEYIDRSCYVAVDDVDWWPNLETAHWLMHERLGRDAMIGKVILRPALKTTEDKAVGGFYHRSTGAIELLRTPTIVNSAFVHEYLHRWYHLHTGDPKASHGPAFRSFESSLRDALRSRVDIVQSR